MQEDPIIEEIRLIRDRMAAELNYDVRAMGERFRKKQKAGKQRIVSLPPQAADEIKPSRKSEVPGLTFRVSRAKNKRAEA